MNELERWLAANDLHLAAGIGWIRQRLDTLAEPMQPADVMTSRPAEPVEPVSEQVSDAPSARPRSFFGRLFGRHEDTASTPAPAATAFPGAPAPAPPPEVRPSAAPLPELMVTAQKAEHPPALVLLARRLGLSEFEAHTLLLCAALELDTRVSALCARAQQDPSRAYPTFALALSLFDNPTWDALSPERPLRYWRLIEIHQPGAQPLVTSALKADERIVNYLKGLNYLDDRLIPLVTPVPREGAALPPTQQAIADAIVSHVEPVSEATKLPLIQLLGADGQSKLLVAQRAASRLGLALYRIAADALPTQMADLETFVRLWQRDSALMPIALYVDASDVDRANTAVTAALQRLFRRGAGVVFLEVRHPWADAGRDTVSFDVTKPTSVEQQAAWTDALGSEAGETASLLAAQFNFNIPSIRSIAGAARSLAGADSAKLSELGWSECLRRTRPALDQLAQRLEPKARWDDLELQAAEKDVLRQIGAQVKARMAVYDAWGFRERMNRGLGISVLFVGESGTGKTMAAEVLANELELLLYRIDLSAVVSKYIGETEKNLRKLFDAAEDGGAILFFDEADALFGKRSEVKDSHDRYANIEINYLLQRIEAYRGLAILATNMKSALDNAFVRRLRFIVTFPFPGQAERAAIWRRVFPPRTPVANLDYARLARLNLTGGSIHNVALNAAFLASHAGSPVTMPHVLEAARVEFRKLEKPINEADFRWMGATA